MEDLHAALAAYLRRQWRSLSCEVVPRRRICGASIADDEGGLYNLDDMRLVRECRDHYCPF